MKRMFLMATALGVLGLLLSTVGIIFVARAWSSFSSGWFVAAGTLPLLGVMLGAELGARGASEPVPWPIPGAARLPFVLVGGTLAGLGMYLAFVITVSIWFANRPEVAQSGFLYLFFHPLDLPSLAETSSTGTQTELSGLVHLVIGMVVSFGLSFWWIGRRKILQ